MFSSLEIVWISIKEKHRFIQGPLNGLKDRKEEEVGTTYRGEKLIRLKEPDIKV